MSAKPKLVPAPPPDPAGLDKLLLSAGQAFTRYLESLIEKKTGTPIKLWDGQDGLGKVLEEQLRAAGVPNKRLPELVTPRAILDAFVPRGVAEAGGTLKPVRRRPYYPNGIKRNGKRRVKRA